MFRKHVTLALGDPAKTSTLTSTKLRKHLATISQILKMDSGELEQLATFMGHTSKTHSEWYRLPSDVYQTAKVSKLLMLAQNNSIDQYKGRSLNELEVGDEILEEDEGSESEREDMSTEDNVDKLEEASVSEAASGKGTAKGRKNKRKTVVKKAWSQEEKRVTEEFFKNHIKKKTAPKKGEVEKLVKNHPELFKDRNWHSIKVYVYNKYKKK